MRELTEREEQEMIDRAKAGDPEANYNMSLWALDRAMAEPEEERWNRLAAKCLVRAAEAGYGPAQARMEELLHKNDPPAEPEDDYTPRHSEPAAAAPHEAAPAASGTPRPARQSASGRSIPDILKGIGGRIRGLFTPSEKASSHSGGSQTGHSRAKKIPFFDFSQWDDARWKRMQLICVIICVVLALLITILLITGRKKTSDLEEEAALPTPEAVTTVEPSPTPEPAVYVDDAVRAEIEAANLEVFPADEDYVTASTSATVSTNSGLNLRRGPASSYGQIVLMANNAKLEVYAHKNGWALVKYNGDTWGWCSSEFIKEQ